MTKNELRYAPSNGDLDDFVNELNLKLHVLAERVERAADQNQAKLHLESLDFRGQWENARTETDVPNGHLKLVKTDRRCPVATGPQN